jgi:hypothetical protein
MRVTTMTMLLLASVTVAGSGLAGDRPAPTRSFYVTIDFRLCEHLGKAVLSEAGLPVSVLPARRVFQFTYYPDLKRMEPEVIQLRIEGEYLDGGEPFLARLAVNRDGLHTARTHVYLDTTEDARRARYKLDVRHRPLDFVLHCERFCSRKEAMTATSDGSSN